MCSFCTFVADVESHVVVRLIGDELDPHGRTLADHSLEGDLSAPTRVEQDHRTGIQPAPQHQPAVMERPGARANNSEGILCLNRSDVSRLVI